MKYTIPLFLLLLIVLISGCTQEVPIEPAAIEHFNYEKDGETYTSYVDERYFDAFDWIKANTPKEAVFLNWWDYGHMIRGKTERDSIVFNPSREILKTVARYSKMSEWELQKVECPECTPHEKIYDVASALVTANPGKTKEIMEKYNSKYIFVTKSDREKIYAIAISVDHNPDDYVDDRFEPKENAHGTILYQMIDEKEVEGFEKVYSDESVKIYQIVE